MLKKIGAITAVDALTKVLGYVLLPVYLGLMPKAEFGEFGFLTSAVGSASLILGLSLYVPLIKNYCALENETEKKGLVSTIFVTLLAWLLIIDIFLVAMMPLMLEKFTSFFEITVSSDYKYCLVILLLNSGIFSLYCYSLIMARRQTREIVFFTFAKFTVIAGLSLLILYINPWQQDSVTNRLLSTASAELIIAFIYVLTIFKKYISLTIDKKILKSNLKTAIPLIPSAIIGLFMTVIDRRLIAEHHGLAELANYNLAMQFLVPIQMLMSAVQVAWAPHIFSISSNSQAMKESVRLMLIALPLMAVAALLISCAVHLSIRFDLVSVKYEQVPLLIIFASIGAIAASLAHLSSNMFVRIEKTGVAFVIALFVLAINWSLNLILVPLYSAYGSATAAGLSNLISLAVSFFILYKLVK